MYSFRSFRLDRKHRILEKKITLFYPAIQLLKIYPSKELVNAESILKTGFQHIETTINGYIFIFRFHYVPIL